MGWLYTPDITREELINDIVNDEENDSGIWKTLRHCTRGNVLWMVKQITRKSTGEATRVIGCYLLNRLVEKQDNREIVSWGYKDMTESMGPHYYSCPLSYLSDVPVANEQWRKKVHQYHRKIDVGDRLILQFCKIPYVEVQTTRPLVGIYEGNRYRIKRSLIADILPAGESDEKVDD